LNEVYATYVLKEEKIISLSSIVVHTFYSRVTVPGEFYKKFIFVTYTSPRMKAILWLFRCAMLAWIKCIANL